MTRIAVTGADGYIGRHVVGRLPATRVVRMTRRNVVGGKGEWFAFDLTDPNPQLPPDVAAVIHLAADIQQRMKRTDELENLSALLRDAVRQKATFIYVSSQSAKRPMAEYGARKAAAERLVTASGGIIVRPGLVVGGRKPHGLAALMSNISRMWVLPSFGKQVFVQPIHADDLAAALIALVDRAPKQKLELAREPIPLSSYVSLAAVSEGRNPPLFVPFPATIMRLVSIGARKGIRASIRQAVNVERMEDDLASLGLTHKSLHAISVRSNQPVRRALLIEGVRVFRLLGVPKVSAACVRNYVRVVEAGTQRHPIDLAPVTKFGVVGVLARGKALQLDVLCQRLQLALAIFEYTPAGASVAMRFHRRSWFGTAASLALAGPGAALDMLRSIVTSSRTPQ